MTHVKSRFRHPTGLDEAFKLIKSGSPSLLKSFRGRKRLWEEGVYETAEHDDELTRNRSPKKSISLAKVKWVETGDDK